MYSTRTVHVHAHVWYIATCTVHVYHTCTQIKIWVGKWNDFHEYFIMRG